MGRSPLHRFMERGGSHQWFLWNLLLNLLLVLETASGSRHGLHSLLDGAASSVLLRVRSGSAGASTRTQRLPTESEVKACEQQVKSLEQATEDCQKNLEKRQETWAKAVDKQKEKRKDARAEIPAEQAKVAVQEYRVKELRDRQATLYRRLGSTVDAAAAEGIDAAYATPQVGSKHQRLRKGGRRGDDTPTDEELVDRWLKCGKVKEATALSMQACVGRTKQEETRQTARWSSYQKMAATADQTTQILKSKSDVMDEEIESVEAANARLESHTERQ